MSVVNLVSVQRDRLASAGLAEDDAISRVDGYLSL